MRFDLELKIVSQLTRDGLDELSNILYGIDEKMLYAIWDDNSAINSQDKNVGNINTRQFNKFKSANKTFFSSGVNTETDDLKFLDNIVYGSNVVPYFNGGFYKSNNNSFICSKNNIVDKFTFDGKYYTYTLSKSVNISDILISTYEFVHPGYTANKKSFKSVPWDSSYYNVLVANGATEEEALDKTLKYIFLKDTADYKFSIVDETIYLSVDRIQYQNKVIGEVTASTNRVFALQEFPVADFSINELNTSEYIIRGGIVVLKSDATVNVGDTLHASWYVDPVISYIDSTRNQEEDYVFFNINMNPRLINYKSGALCLSNTAGDGSIPLNLTVKSNKENLYGTETARVTAKLTGVNEVPVTNETVTLEILNSSGRFLDSNTSTTTKTTLVDGCVIADLIPETENNGFYLQSYAVSGNTITLPFELEDVDPENCFIYFIQDNDPILGDRYSVDYDTKFKIWGRGDSFDKLMMNGRKIAYVSMQDNDGKLTSKFITPSSVLYEDNVEIRFINYFYGDNITSNTLLGSASASSQIINTITGETLVSTVAASSAFASGVLPNEQIKEYRYTCPKVTKLVFDNTIPKDSTIKGYWLITNGNIKIRATYQNDYISLTSETVTIPLSRVKTSNSIGDIHSNVGYTFELNKYNTSSGASQLGAFGYLTISEYLKNPYGLNAVSIYCTHSDCIYKRCSHPDPTIRKNFVLDTGRVGCAHNKIWDADPNNFVCEAEDAHLVNPFIMHLEGI